MVKYLGKGFIVGVPARNLTDEEARAFGIDKLVKSGLYELEKEQPRIRKSKRLETADAGMEGIDSD